LIVDGSTTAVFTGTELHAWKWTTNMWFPLMEINL